MARVIRKKKYVTFVTGDERPQLGLCQTTKHFYRKTIGYAGAPLHKYADQITEEKFHEIINAFGECIYKKIIDGDVYEFPCRRFGRIYIKKFDKAERSKSGFFKHLKPLLKGYDVHYIWWVGKWFKNCRQTMVLLKNTDEVINRYKNDVNTSFASYYTNIENLRR